jgi:hypothetical protein
MPRKRSSDFGKDSPAKDTEKISRVSKRPKRLFSAQTKSFKSKAEVAHGRQLLSVIQKVKKSPGLMKYVSNLSPEEGEKFIKELAKVFSGRN